MTTLEHATLTYWEVSQAYHNRPQAKNISVQKAIEQTSVHALNVGPHRRVYRALYHLGHTLIYRGKKRGRAKV